MQSRRNEVIHLLLVGSAAKLEAGLDDQAGVLLEKAYRQATHPEPLPGPWIPLLAYRLAHLHLRRGSDRPALGRVLGLLDQADQPRFMGPWPALYRLPVLARMGADKETIEGAFRRADALVRAVPRDRTEQAEGLLAPTASGDAALLLGYFALCFGLRGDVPWRDDRMAIQASSGSQNWRLVGTNLGANPPPLPRRLAVLEFEAYQESDGSPEDLFFALPAEGTAWMRVRRGQPEPTHPQALRLLARLAMGSLPLAGDLREEVLGPDASDAAWEKARSRLNKRLQKMLQTEGQAAIVLDLEGRVRLRPNLCVLGLVEDDALDPTRRIRGSRFSSDAPMGYCRSDPRT